jgi:hypothetical protein
LAQHTTISVLVIRKREGERKRIVLHLGCNLGPKVLEMLEEESDCIRQLENWNPSMQDSCYSTKLPMRPVQKLAGLVHANGMHYNPRTVVEVLEELAMLTPIGQWAIDACSKVEDVNF